MPREAEARPRILDPPTPRTAEPPAPRRRKKIRHIASGTGAARVGSHSQSLQDETQGALVLVDSGRLEGMLDPRSHGDPRDPSAAIGEVGAGGFIESDDEQAVLFERGRIEEAGEVVPEPAVRH